MAGAGETSTMSFRQHAQSYLHESRQRQGEDDHLPTETLHAYHLGRLDAQQEDQVQEHLANCPTCAKLFLGLVNFLEWDLDSTRLSVEDLTRSWQAFLERKNAETKEERELCPITPR
jgi:hypothetical protein